MVSATKVGLSVVFVTIALTSAIWPVEAVTVDVLTDRPFYNVGETAKVSLRLFRFTQSEPRQALISLRVLDPDGVQVPPFLRFFGSLPLARDFSIALEKMGQYRIVACADVLHGNRVCDTTRVLVEEVQTKNAPQPSPETRPVIVSPTVPEAQFPYWALMIPPVALVAAAFSIWRFHRPFTTRSSNRANPGRQIPEDQGRDMRMRLELEREEVAQIIRELEREHGEGRITDEAYVKFRMKYMDRLRNVMGRLKRESRLNPAPSSQP